MVILINISQLYLLFLRYGVWGIFFISFASATILPLSSEIIVGLAYQTELPKEEILIFASIGNNLACLFNYVIGYYIFRKTNARHFSFLGFQIRFPDDKSFIYQLIQKKGVVALLISWLPIVGDPITILAGYFKIPLIYFFWIVTPLRILRYYLLLFL